MPCGPLLFTEFIQYDFPLFMEYHLPLPCRTFVRIQFLCLIPLEFPLSPFD